MFTELLVVSGAFRRTHTLYVPAVMLGVCSVAVPNVPCVGAHAALVIPPTMYETNILAKMPQHSNNSRF